MIEIIRHVHKSIERISGQLTGARMVQWRRPHLRTHACVLESTSPGVLRCVSYFFNMVEGELL